MTELACVEGVVCGGCAQLEAGVDVDHVLDHDGLAGQEALQHLAAVLLAQAGDLRTGQHEVTPLPHGPEDSKTPPTWKVQIIFS